MSKELIVVPKEEHGNIEKLETWSRELVISTSTERAETIIILKNVKTTRQRFVDLFANIKDKTYTAWKAVVAQEKSFTDRLNAVEKQGKEAVKLFDRQEEERRLEKERRLNAEAAEKARKERERLEREAAKLKTPELREARLEQAAAIVPPTIHIESDIVRNGDSTSRSWKAKLTDLDSLIEAAAKGNSLARSFLSFDQKVADKFASATKGLQIQCPGVEWYQEETLRIRR